MSDENTTTEVVEQEKPAEEAKPEKITANGVTRPKDGSITGRVWKIADEISAATKAPAERKDVMDACKAENINGATAATQYGKWRKFNGLKKAPKAVTPKAEDVQSTAVDANGNPVPAAEDTPAEAPAAE